MTYTHARSAQAAVPTAVLHDMSQEDFTQVILDAIGRDTDQAVWDALTADESVVNRTKECLAGILSDVGMQITQANADLDQLHAACLERGLEGKQEYFQAKAEHAGWRSRTAGFSRLVQRRYSFVKSRAAALAAVRQDNGLTKPSRKHNREALEKLARAVAVHQRRVTSGDGDERDDETLWACLTSLTAMIRTGEELPLSQWLGYLDDERGDDS